jgi:hypothetical protein
MKQTLKMIFGISLLIILTIITTFYFSEKKHIANTRNLLTENAKLELKLAQAQMAVIDIAMTHFQAKEEFLSKIKPLIREKDQEVIYQIDEQISSGQEDLQSYSFAKVLLLRKIKEEQAWLETTKAMVISD